MNGLIFELFAEFRKVVEYQMDKEQLFKKFTSRKFICTAVADIAALIALFVGDGEIVQSVAALVMAGVTVFYLWTEGKLDKENIKNLAGAAANVADKLGASDKVEQSIEMVGEMAGTLVDEMREDAESGNTVAVPEQVAIEAPDE